MAREGGMIQLVSGEVNVLHAYIIQGERELTAPSPLHDNALAGAGRLFRRVSLLEKEKKKKTRICALSAVRRAQQRVRSLFVRLLFISRQPLCAV